MATPHIKAEIGDFAKTVLMPGDPLRSKFIAESFLTDARLVNNVRGVYGYTGLYEGVPVSVMASGMGIPSISIYSYELYNFFGVENIIRVGSIGGIADSVKIRDIILGMGASTNSAVIKEYELCGDFAPICDHTLLSFAEKAAKEIGVTTHVGNILSSDTFYNQREGANEKWRDMGILGVEMEAAGLYINAAKAKKRALAICTVSDHIFTGESLSSDERERSFTDMIKIALSVAKEANSL